MLMGHFGPYPESPNFKQALMDSKGKQVKGIPNPHYKRKRNFSKFERGESSRSIRQRRNLSSPQYKGIYVESFRGYLWQNPRGAYWKGYKNDYKSRYM